MVKLDLSSNSPLVMGILNVTPDSFSDGGKFSGVERALQHARQMCVDGADIIDIGGESTRPGAPEVSVQDELTRVIPAINAIVADDSISIPISVDTSKPEVMRQAVAAGAVLVNDVRALQEPGALECCAELGVAVCLMHMKGQPRTMQFDPQYDDVFESVVGFLQERASVCIAAGIKVGNIIIDPGFGFGKTLDHNLLLLSRTNSLSELGFPLLVGVSRKSMFEKLLGAAVEERVVASVVAAVHCAMSGAKIIRVHDVRETVQGIKTQAAIASAST